MAAVGHIPMYPWPVTLGLSAVVIECGLDASGGCPSRSWKCEVLPPSSLLHAASGDKDAWTRFHLVWGAS